MAGEINWLVEIFHEKKMIINGNTQKKRFINNLLSLERDKQHLETKYARSIYLCNEMPTEKYISFSPNLCSAMLLIFLFFFVFKRLAERSCNTFQIRLYSICQSFHRNQKKKMNKQNHTIKSYQGKQQFFRSLIIYLYELLGEHTKSNKKKQNVKSGWLLTL